MNTKEIEIFIQQNRKNCWENEYENGEYCIGEKTVLKFIKSIQQENERLKEEYNLCQKDWGKASENAEKTLVRLKEVEQYAKNIRTALYARTVQRDKGWSRIKELEEENERLKVYETNVNKLIDLESIKKDKARIKELEEGINKIIKGDTCENMVVPYSWITEELKSLIKPQDK